MIDMAKRFKLKSKCKCGKLVTSNMGDDQFQLKKRIHIEAVHKTFCTSKDEWNEKIKEYFG